MKLRFRHFDLKLAHNWMVASSQTTGGKMIYPAVLVELRDHDGVIGFAGALQISYADKLQRPLLILHGMVDDNVFFQDSVQLIEKLIELRKTDYFDVMFYPKESHSFTKPESWTDEYERILKFFDAHLRG